MNLFKKKPEEKPAEKKALEELIKKTFCNKQSVVGCDYHKELWGPNTCGFYIRILNEAKYWNR